MAKREKKGGGVAVPLLQCEEEASWREGMPGINSMDPLLSSRTTESGHPSVRKDFLCWPSDHKLNITLEDKHQVKFIQLKSKTMESFILLFIVWARVLLHPIFSLHYQSASWLWQRQEATATSCCFKSPTRRKRRKRKGSKFSPSCCNIWAVAQ